MRTRLLLVIACGVAVLGGCARKTPEVATVTPPPILVPPPAPKPQPPQGAAPNLTIPAATPDGGYATLNRGLTSDAALWHLRAALNVAALQCNIGDPAGVAGRIAAILGASPETPRAETVTEPLDLR